MKKLTALSLVLVGIVLGCGAAVTVPKSFAAPEPGKWRCYKDLWKPREPMFQAQFTKSMNTIAPHAPAGTVIPTAAPAASLICVKH